jgi:phosphotransferase system  glucose/maltose/N-acetylglucosamine-specific IIC component
VTDSDDIAFPPLPGWRRSLGIVLAVLAGICLVGFVVARWNPWRFVWLREVFGNPFSGLVIVTLLTLIAFMTLAPVRNEAAQGRRNAVKWALIILLVLSLPIYGLFHTLYSVATQELAHSPSGERTVAKVTHGQDYEVRLWTGSGLAMREDGSLGRPCGDFKARFRGEDLVHIETNYGNFDVRLDPATGRPLNPIGPTCSG